MTPLASLFVETARDESRLLAALSATLTPEAVALSRRTSLQLLEAAPAKDDRRRIRTLFLLCLDALNDRRTEAARALRWRRFIRALAPFARETHSPALLGVVAENADLLAPVAERNPAK